MIRGWFASLARKAARRAARPPRATAQFRLEVLEGRTLLSTLAPAPPAWSGPTTTAAASGGNRDGLGYVTLYVTLVRLDAAQTSPVWVRPGYVQQPPPPTQPATSPPPARPSEDGPTDAARPPTPAASPGPVVVRIERPAPPIPLPGAELARPAPEPPRGDPPPSVNAFLGAVRPHAPGEVRRATPAGGSPRLPVVEPTTPPGPPAAAADAPRPPTPAGPTDTARPRVTPPAEAVRPAQYDPDSAGADPGGNRPPLAAPARPGTVSPEPPVAAADGVLARRFAADGDQAAFTELVRRHGRGVLAISARVLGDPDLAQDAVQATFLALARRAAWLDGRGSLAAWLYKVAYRMALRLRRAVARQRRLDREAARPLFAPDDPFTGVDELDLCRVLREELRRLPDQYRVPLVLYYLDGKAHAEVARATGLPRGSVAKRIGEGLARLRDRLAARGFPP